MSGKRITQRQENLYMNKRQQGQSQETAAAKSGISERSARRIEKGERPSIPRERHWRTREDPLDAIWESELVPLLEEEPGLTGLKPSGNIWKMNTPDNFLTRYCVPCSVVSNIGKPRKGRIRPLSSASRYPLASKAYLISAIPIQKSPSRGRCLAIFCISFVLLIVAGAMSRSFWAVKAIPR